MHALTDVLIALPSILAGSFVTIGNVAVSLGMGLILGVPLAAGQVYGGPWLRRLAAAYVWFFRGVPILVLLFLCYGLFISMGLSVDPFVVCCLVLGATSTAYQSQIFRGAIESLPQGQLQAARALGMRDAQGHSLHYLAAGPAPFDSGLGQRIFHFAQGLGDLLRPGHPGYHGPRHFCGSAHA